MKTRLLFVLTLFCVILLSLVPSGGAASSPALRLVGISLGPEPGDAKAIIEDLTTREQVFHTTGDKVGNAIILAIQEGRVLLQQEKEAVKVWLINHRLGFGKISPVPEVGKPAKPRLKSKEPDPYTIAPTVLASITGLEDHEEIRKRLAPPLKAQKEMKRHTVGQDTVDYLRADLEDLLTTNDLKILEHPTVGSGLLVDQVTAQAFQDLGLKEGDLLLKLNGISLGSVGRMSVVDDVLSRAKIINLIALRGSDLIALKFAVQ